MEDTIQMAVDRLTNGYGSVVATGEGVSVNWWMIMSVVEMAVIVFLLLRHTAHDSERSRLKRKVMSEGDIDFGNRVNSSFNARNICKELIVKCHPDRFMPDEEKAAVANDLSARIGKCRNDIKQLEKLKQEAIEKLNIDI